mmetsp:Transcript_25595/g.41788  ORF Transcript_25595/g.41788 Transcript_25595/m.41788 type:complete len:687 (-) Transcript_25595:104-2164(-)
MTMSKTTASVTYTELQPRLQKLPKHWPENEERVLLREGVLFIEEDKSLKPRWCFLFNDCFLECKPACDFADGQQSLLDANTAFRFKNYVMLRTCYIQENPDILKRTAKEQHHSTPFLLCGHDNNNDGDNHNHSHKPLNLIFSAQSDGEREEWLSAIHRQICGIHETTHSDLMSYAWQNEYRQGTLFHAVHARHHSLIQSHFADQTMNDDVCDIGGHNLLHIAAAANNVSFLEDFGDKFNVDTADCNGWSALRIACDNDHLDAVRHLVEELSPNLDEYYPVDKSINPRNAPKELQLDDRSILHELCQRDQFALVEILLQSHAVNVEALTADGRTPLHIAAQRNHEHCVRLLLQYGAPPNLGDFKGVRALHLTTKETVARWLVAYGARLDLVDNTKRACRECWSSNGDAQPPLEKYTSLLQVVGAADCQVQSVIADDKETWFDDKLSDACLLCAAGFTLLSRRHHCRACGLLVCQLCSARKLAFHKEADKKALTERACDKCFNRALSRTLRRKTFTFCEKRYTEMTPSEFYTMCVMETTQSGSYEAHKASLLAEQQQQQLQAQMEQKQAAAEPEDVTNEEEEQKMANLNVNVDAQKPKPKRGHKITKSMSALYKRMSARPDKSDKNASDKTGKHKQAQSEALDQVNKAVSKAQERGEKLAEINDKAEEMADAAQNFNDLAKQLANKKW